MSKKLIQLALSAWLFALSFPAAAQQPAKIPRIGFLVGTTGSAASTRTEGFRQGLRDLGYVEGKNILIEYRYLEGKMDRVPTIVTELVQLKVDVLVSPIGEAIRAAKQVTKAIPIVMVITTDPVAAGLVDSLAHPGGNVTGVTRLATDLSGKRLELLQEVVPTISRVGVLLDADYPRASNFFRDYEAAARALKIPLQLLEVRKQNPDFNGAFQTAVKGHVDALITTSTGLFLTYRKQIADLAIKNRLPLMSERSNFAEAGGLMSYAGSDIDAYRRAATYVDKILKGSKPADLPVEQATKFELVMNLKTAKQIGLTIPQTVLYRADKVIR